MRLGAVVQGLIHTFGHGDWGQIQPGAIHPHFYHHPEQKPGGLREYAEEENTHPEHTWRIYTSGNHR
jgi:hypothetical protein